MINDVDLLMIGEGRQSVRWTDELEVEIQNMVVMRKMQWRLIGDDLRTHGANY